MKKKMQGFTLLEMTIAVAIVGVTTASSFGAYRYYIPKAQFSESLKMMEAEAPNVLTANKISACTTTGADQEIKGKYGILTVSGAYKKVSGQTCPTDCTLSYKFNDTDVSNKLAGKVISAGVTAGGQLSKVSTETTVPPELISTNFKTITVATTDNCTTLDDGSLTVTTGNLTGSEKSTSATNPTEIITPTDPNGEIVSPEEALKNAMIGGYLDAAYYPSEGVGASYEQHSGKINIILPTVNLGELYKPANWSSNGTSRLIFSNIMYNYAGQVYDLETAKYINVKNKTVLVFNTKGAVVYGAGEYCAEGSGCSVVKAFKATDRLYFKGKLIKEIERYGSAMGQDPGTG